MPIKWTICKKWKILRKAQLPRLNLEEIENINRPITSTEIEILIKNFPTIKSPGSDGFTGKFYHTFREELTPVLFKNLSKYSRRRNTPNLILQGHHHPYTKTRHRCHKERKLQANIPGEHSCKNPQQNTSKQNPTAH